MKYVGVWLCCFAPISASAADFALLPKVPVGPDRFVDMAVSEDGQRIACSWTLVNKVFVRESTDGGASFGPTQTVATARRAIGHAFFGFPGQTAPVVDVGPMSPAILANDQLETDLFAILLPPALHHSRLRLYAANAGQSGFSIVQTAGIVSDEVSPEAGLRDFTMITAGDSLLITWNAFHFNDGNEGETWFARGTLADGFEAPVNLSREVLASAAGNDFDPRLASDATGDEIFVGWTEVSSEFLGNIAHTTDGGETWSRLPFNTGWFDDLDYARTAGRLVVSGTAGGFPEATRIDVAISDDHGQTFDIVTAAQGGISEFGSPTLLVLSPRIAVSADGSVIAVLFDEEDCTGLGGCTSATSNDIVLTISSDGGQTFERIGKVAASFLSEDYDVMVSSNGNTVFVITNDVSGPEEQNILVRAVRTPAAGVRRQRR